MRASLAALVVVVSWGVAFIGTFLTRRFATALGLVDAPNIRSSHTTPTPSGGGVGLGLAGSLAAAFLPMPSEVWVILLLSLVIAGVGLRDDIRHVAAWLRFATQLLVIAGGLFALDIFQTSHSLFSALALLGGVWWINLFNFMDGIDGFAGTEALFMLATAAALAVLQQPSVINLSEWVWMIAIAAAVIAFLQFNWPPATIFMGDVGSTWLAFVIFCVAAISVRDGWLTIPAWLILGGVFIVDSTTTLLRRMFRGARWFEAHRSHAYQRLAVQRKAHRPVTLLAVVINVLWLAPFAYGSLVWPQWGWLGVALAYTPLIASALAVGAGTSDHVPLVGRAGREHP